MVRFFTSGSNMDVPGVPWWVNAVGFILTMLSIRWGLWRIIYTIQMLHYVFKKEE